jgi:carboxylesterase type B
MYQAVTRKYSAAIVQAALASQVRCVSNPTRRSVTIVLLLNWVHDNITAFGGDSSHVVLFRQSAGGASVDYWSFSWKDDPIVSDLVSMSGTSLSFLPNTREYSQLLFYSVLQTVCCGGRMIESA